ncbi:hypothetical protein [Paenibacillus mendelii]|uniref:Uncharacterized protein n=1 Tax=Paenibacillus mendelii TaxID=206163 RepID=A0ABV6J6X2_9BACL|nr:hypothetical protein [Paenibacillus mendelii]MCQ6560993.1 hypothetical protein [Paenibacillus mendelii]
MDAFLYMSRGTHLLAGESPVTGLAKRPRVARLMLSSEIIAKDVLMKYVQEFDGLIQEYSRVSQGVIQEGDATVWIYYRENLNLDKELSHLEREYNFKPKTGITWI